ncbi:acylphosphatase [Staphylococcus sp. SS87]|nr:acylphosphatase [Staphylococcus singaporensis]MBO0928395.1 acylphosphatase [Staphylococcus sp. 30403_3112M30944]MBO0946167.1 acylphosphatase [Staphylococcus sp. 30402_3112M30943]MBO0963083.1 acylphosphatase [Staphylococcus sp. 30400_3112M30941]MBO0966248.1 acylphosphatase [Staphylococcus sp. 30401_3112M30942]UMT79423.1 acylphosphatase [Staphylococcus roterodami]
MKHVLLQVFGRVQGVGFRYFTQRIAMKYNIVGTVQNVDDYVEIYAQGDEEDIDRFIQSVIDGASPASDVTSHHVEELELNQTLSDFRTI